MPELKQITNFASAMVLSNFDIILVQAIIELYYSFTLMNVPAIPLSKLIPPCTLLVFRVASPFPASAETDIPAVVRSPHSTDTMPEKQIEAISPCFQPLVVTPNTGSPD